VNTPRVSDLKPMPEGYSGKPLPEKLGLKSGMRFIALNAPPGLETQLVTEVELNRLARLAPFDCALGFAAAQRSLTELFAKLTPRMNDHGMIWIAWPKKASGVATGVTENRVREAGLAAGLVDVKVCAIDATWSGLKFVRRLRDRGG